MKLAFLSAELAVSPQIVAADLPELARAGIRAILCNRPDGEGADQPNVSEIEAAAIPFGIAVRYLPVESGKVTDTQAHEFGCWLADAPKPALAYCRSGMRSASLWGLSMAATQSLPTILEAGKTAGYDLTALTRRIAAGGKTVLDVDEVRHTIVIVGGGAAGLAVAASLLKRDATLDIAVVDPADTHYYQPGWTLVGAGVFSALSTARQMAAVLPRGVHWIKAAVAAFEPDRNALILDGCRVVRYEQLIVCPGLKLDWHGIDGLVEALGHNGVTSNYRYDLAPYTWKLVQQTRRGRALFTQPPMPIKCAGAPQKAMYLSADFWRRQRHLHDIDVEFYNAGAVLFGVSDYVPALMEYVERYRIALNFSHTLMAVDGARRMATFKRTAADGTVTLIEREYDMLHVVPPQKAPDFVRVSPLADAAGWIDVDPATLRHRRYENIHALGDATNTSNAKTAAAARKQAPVAAHNVLHAMGRGHGVAQYDGYGSCPLTVERGKIVLAEFLYGGKVAPTFPSWLIDGRKPSRLAWLLKERMLPPLYWRAMLKGHEWLVRPEIVG